MSSGEDMAATRAESATARAVSAALMTIGAPGPGDDSRAGWIVAVAGWAAVVLLLAAAGLHGYWAEGGLWPGRTGAELAAKVMGPAGDDRPPPRAASWVVAGLLMGAAGLVAAATAGVGHWLVLTGTAVASGVLGLRGLAGLLASGVVQRDSDFARLDRRLYSPLCLGLAAAGAAVLLLPGR